MTTMAINRANHDNSNVSRKPYRKRTARSADHFLREWRIYKKLSQEDLAEKVGLSVPQISKIENGRQGLRQKRLQQFAVALNIDTADIFRAPESKPECELLEYVMAMAPARQFKALKVLKAMEEEDETV